MIRPTEINLTENTVYAEPLVHVTINGNGFTLHAPSIAHAEIRNVHIVTSFLAYSRCYYATIGKPQHRWKSVHNLYFDSIRQGAECIDHDAPNPSHGTNEKDVLI